MNKEVSFDDFNKTLLKKNNKVLMQLGGNVDIDYNKSFIKSESVNTKKHYALETATLLRKALSRLNSNGIFLDKKLIEKIEKRIKDLETVEKKLSFLAENMTNAYNYDKADKSLQGGDPNRVFNEDQLVKFNEVHKKIYEERAKAMIKPLNDIFIKLTELSETGKIDKITENIEKILENSKDDIAKTKLEPEKTGISKTAIATGIGVAAAASVGTAYLYKENIDIKQDFDKKVINLNKSNNTYVKKKKVLIDSINYLCEAFKINLDEKLYTCLSDDFKLSEPLTNNLMTVRVNLDNFFKYCDNFYNYTDDEKNNIINIFKNYCSIIKEIIKYEDKEKEIKQKLLTLLNKYSVLVNNENKDYIQNFIDDNLNRFRCSAFLIINALIRKEKDFYITKYKIDLFQEKNFYETILNILDITLKRWGNNNEISKSKEYEEFISILTNMGQNLQDNSSDNSVQFYNQAFNKIEILYNTIKNEEFLEEISIAHDIKSIKPEKFIIYREEVSVRINPGLYSSIKYNLQIDTVITIDSYIDISGIRRIHITDPVEGWITIVYYIDKDSNIITLDYYEKHIKKAIVQDVPYLKAPVNEFSLILNQKKISTTVQIKNSAKLITQLIKYIGPKEYYSGYFEIFNQASRELYNSIEKLSIPINELKNFKLLETKDEKIIKYIDKCSEKIKDIEKLFSDIYSLFNNIIERFKKCKYYNTSLQEFINSIIEKLIQIKDSTIIDFKIDEIQNCDYRYIKFSEKIFSFILLMFSTYYFKNEIIAIIQKFNIHYIDDVTLNYNIIDLINILDIICGNLEKKIENKPIVYGLSVIIKNSLENLDGLKQKLSDDQKIYYLPSLDKYQNTELLNEKLLLTNTDQNEIPKQNSFSEEKNTLDDSSLQNVQIVSQEDSEKLESMKLSIYIQILSIVDKQNLRAENLINDEYNKLLNDTKKQNIVNGGLKEYDALYKDYVSIIRLSDDINNLDLIKNEINDRCEVLYIKIQNEINKNVKDFNIKVGETKKLIDNKIKDNKIVIQKIKKDIESKEINDRCENIINSNNELLKQFNKIIIEKLKDIFKKISEGEENESVSVILDPFIQEFNKTNLILINNLYAEVTKTINTKYINDQQEINQNADAIKSELKQYNIKEYSKFKINIKDIQIGGLSIIDQVDTIKTEILKNIETEFDKINLYLHSDDIKIEDLINMYNKYNEKFIHENNKLKAIEKKLIDEINKMYVDKIINDITQKIDKINKIKISEINNVDQNKNIENDEKRILIDEIESECLDFKKDILKKIIKKYEIYTSDDFDIEKYEEYYNDFDFAIKESNKSFLDKLRIYIYKSIDIKVQEKLKGMVIKEFDDKINDIKTRILEVKSYEINNVNSFLKHEDIKEKFFKSIIKKSDNLIQKIENLYNKIIKNIIEFQKNDDTVWKEFIISQNNIWNNNIEKYLEEFTKEIETIREETQKIFAEEMEKERIKVIEYMDKKINDLSNYLQSEEYTTERINKEVLEIEKLYNFDTIKQLVGGEEKGDFIKKLFEIFNKSLIQIELSFNNFIAKRKISVNNENIPPNNLKEIINIIYKEIEEKYNAVIEEINKNKTTLYDDIIKMKSNIENYKNLLNESMNNLIVSNIDDINNIRSTLLDNLHLLYNEIENKEIEIDGKTFKNEYDIIYQEYDKFIYDIKKNIHDLVNKIIIKNNNSKDIIKEYISDDYFKEIISVSKINETTANILLRFKETVNKFKKEIELRKSEKKLRNQIIAYNGPINDLLWNYDKLLVNINNTEYFEEILGTLNKLNITNKSVIINKLKDNITLMLNTTYIYYLSIILKLFDTEEEMSGPGIEFRTNPIFNKIDILNTEIDKDSFINQNEFDSLKFKIDEIIKKLDVKGYKVGDYIGGSKKSYSTKKYKIIKKS